MCLRTSFDSFSFSRFSVNQHSFVLISVYFYSWKQILGSVSRPAISSPRSKRLPASSLRKLGRKQKRGMKGKGEGREGNSFPLVLPLQSSISFTLAPNYRAISRLETLATQAKILPNCSKPLLIELSEAE